jgi:hypothetical protein
VPAIRIGRASLGGGVTVPQDFAKPDPRIQDILTDVEKMDLQVVDGLEFVDQDVYLDGRRFVRCGFQRCKLFVKLGVFALDDPTQLVQNTFYFLGPAGSIQNTLSFLQTTQVNAGPSAPPTS